MPKVGTLRANFTDKTEVFDLWYSQKYGFEIRGLPESYVRVSKMKLTDYRSEAELKSALLKSVEKYRDYMRKERRVILFKLQATSDLISNGYASKHGGRGWSGTKKGVSERFASFFGQSVPDYTFGIEYKVCSEIDDGGKTYREIEKDGSFGYSFDLTNHDKHWTVIDWTEERELLFKSVYAAMQNLIFKLSEFFVDDDKKLLLKIDNAGGNIKLLS